MSRPPEPETLIDLAQDKIAVIDETGRFRYLNAATRDLLGFDPDGDHAAEYVRDAGDAAIELGDDGVALTVDGGGSDPLAAAHDAPGVSAD